MYLVFINYILFFEVVVDGIELVSVSDLGTYTFCKRKLWLLKRARIEGGERDWDSVVKFRLLCLITSILRSKIKIHSLTDFMLKALREMPGEIVGTEVSLRRGELFGRIDVLRKTKDGFIIQEEKTSDPPDGDGVWPHDAFQIDAYAFLAETNNRYMPVINGIIIYNDLKPRKVKPNPKRAKAILEQVIILLEKDILPEAEANINKCTSCPYYPLCQILPPEGGLKETEIKNAFSKPPSIKEITATH